MSRILYPSQQKYINKFFREEDSLIIEMEKLASERDIPILAKESALFLEQLVMITRPKRVLELGTAIAYSSIRMARHLRKKGIIHTIEKSDDNIELATEFIKRSGYEDKIRIIEGNALNLMPTLGKKYDLIFLDADKEDYKRLFDYSIILLKKGGIIIIDNLLWHGFAAAKEVPSEHKTSTKSVREFNKYFTSQANLKASILAIGDGIGLGIKI
jgi:caffeoyl-CoA O-methyltransferase